MCKYVGPKIFTHNYLKQLKKNTGRKKLPSDCSNNLCLKCTLNCF